MEKMKAIFLKYRHAIPLLAYGIVYLVWFAYLEKTVTKDYQVIHMTLDDYIPFCEVFVIPYLLWFAYIAVVIIYFFLKDRDDYYKLCIFLSVGMTVFLVVSTLWPNGHHLRPQTMPRDNIFTRLVSMLYMTDTSTNLWPSIHVYNSIGAHLAIIKSKHFQNRPGIRCASFLLAASIILSTMFIKQHSVFDVLTAFALSAIMYVIVYRYDLLVSYRQKLQKNHKKIKPEAI